MGKDSWIEKTVALTANNVSIVESDHAQPMNTFVLKNLSGIAVYAGLKSTITTTDYEVMINPGDYGMIVRPYFFQQVFLLSTADVTVTVYQVKTDNPMILLPSMAKPIGANNVAVVATVGLQAAELNIDALKNIGVNVNNIPDVNINSLPSIDLAGVDAKKVTAAAPGDEVVKATGGKVYAVRAGTGVTLALKDGATEKWHIAAGSKDEFSQPVACATNITLNFAAAGDAWIIYK